MSTTQHRRAKGSGSVIQLKNGKWVARLTLPPTRDRDAQRASRTTTSRRKAEDALREMRAELLAEGPEAAERMRPRPTQRLDTYARDTWFPRLRDATDLPRGTKGALRARTAADYRTLAESHILGPHGIGHLRLSAITALDVEAMGRRLIELDGRSHDTVRRVSQVARMLLKSAERDRFLPAGTAATIEVSAQRPAETQPRITDDGVQRVLAVLLDDAALPEPPAAVLPALLLVTLGIRRGEACGVRWSALDLAADVPTVSVDVSVTELPDGEIVMNPPKSKDSRRVLPLAPAVVAALTAARRAQAESKRGMTEWVGGPGRDLPQRPDALSKYLRTVADLTGIPTASAAHAYRRAVTDRLVGHGVDLLTVSRFLGHGDGGRLVAQVYAGDQRERVIGLGELLKFPAGTA